MSQDFHLLQFDEALKKINYDVIGLCEVKRENEEILDRNGYIIYSYTKARRRGSVGIVVKSTWKNNIESFIGYSDRVCALILSFEKHKFGFVQAYAPTSTSSEEEIEVFYEQLNKATQDIATCTWRVVMGDFNAKIGQFNTNDEDVMGKFGFGLRNERGRRLIEFARNNQLVITNAMFKKKDSRRATWSLGRASNQIDFIMIHKSQKKLVKNVDILSRFEYNSDHKMVRMKMTLNVLKPKRRIFLPPRITITKDELKIVEFQKTLDGEIKNFPTNPKEISLQSKYDIMTKSVISAAETFRIKHVKESIIRDETKMMIKLRDELLISRKENHEAELAFKEARKRANKMIQNDLRNHDLNELQKAIDGNSNWRNSKNGIRRGKNWIPKLRNKNGDLVTKRDEVLETAALFYEDLYASKMTDEEKEQMMPALANLDDVEKISLFEMEIALSQLKNGRSAGDDEISSELLKLCNEKALDHWRYIFNEIIEKEEIPKQWYESTITLIHKKGDRSDIKNYRPVSKTPVSYKLFARIILNRISSCLDNHQSTSQAGFRSGFSTTDHIFVVQQLIEKCQEFNLPLFLGFIDYNKAFDSVGHPYLWKALHEQDVHDKYIRIMKKIYEGSSAKIKMEKLSRSFSIERGIKQGCCASPKEFNGALQKIFNSIDWSNFGIIIDEERLKELRFADDVLLISHEKNDLLQMMEKVFEASTVAGLTPNISKTKIMTNTNESNFQVNGEQIEKVEVYKYLGKNISIDSNDEIEIEARITSAWRSFWALKKFFKGKLPYHHKKRLLDTCVFPILTYGCQSWNLTENLRERLRVNQRKMERSMMNIKWFDYVNNDKVRKKSKIIDVDETIRQLKWNWAGHVQRLNEDRWARRLELWNPEGIRSKGRPKMRWKDEIEIHASLFWRRKSKNRKAWQELGKSFVKRN